MLKKTKKPSRSSKGLTNKSIKSLEKKLRSLLYPLIKERDGNTCWSCGRNNLLGMNFQAGHYQKAELCNLKWRYNTMNIHSQCAGCNLWKRGNTIEYRKKMINVYGEKEVKHLEDHYKDALPMNFNSRAWLEKEIEYYKHVVKLAKL